jgi:4'-phosphopantetheinyl transferase
MNPLAQELPASPRVGAVPGRWGTQVGNESSPPRAGAARPLDLWVLHVDVGAPGWDIESAAALLSDPERRRAAQGIPAVQRTRILMRAALRSLLGEILRMDPAAVPLAVGPGKPRLEGSASRRGLDASCSTSGGVGLVTAVRGGRVGVDVERIGGEDLWTAAAEGWLAPAERAALAKLPVSERSRAITRAWAQKEAVLKGEGTGLTGDPASTVTPVADRGRVRHWWVAPLEVPTSHIASLAIAPGGWGVRLRSTPAMALRAMSAPLSFSV